MTRIRLQIWGSRLLTPRTHTCPRRLRPSQCSQENPLRSIRLYSASTATSGPEHLGDPIELDSLVRKSQRSNQLLPSPDPSRSVKSAKLAALHARLSLSPKLPLQTLARSLVDPTADSNILFNNSSFSVLGSDLIGYWTSEHIISNYPRLPMAIVFAAQDAYAGPKALSTVAEGWGVEHTPYPGGEVDPGILQYNAVKPGGLPPQIAAHQTSSGEEIRWKRGINWRVVKDDEFGEVASTPSGWKKNKQEQEQNPDQSVTTLEYARHNFVRAVVGALYLHTGAATSHAFFKAHILSRHLALHNLFDFPVPTRDLSRLCAREGFEPPVARLISESGRLSRHPVFVVGVFSGKDKLGEAAGGSLDEARVRASAAALRSWYLYSPLDATVPSSTEPGRATTNSRWKPNMVDCGEVIH